METDSIQIIAPTKKIFDFYSYDNDKMKIVVCECNHSLTLGKLKIYSKSSDKETLKICVCNKDQCEISDRFYIEAWYSLFKNTNV